MGFWSFITRPFRSFNIESRTLRLLERKKPIPAPKYEANVKELEQYIRDNPHVVQELAIKDDSLDKRLKDVFVTSTSANALSKTEKISRPLPMNKEPIPSFDYGFLEPEVVRPGRITLRNVFALLSKRQKNRKVPLSTLANDFKISEESVDKIIKYYGAFDLLKEFYDKRTSTIKLTKIDEIKDVPLKKLKSGN